MNKQHLVSTPSGFLSNSFVSRFFLFAMVFLLPLPGWASGKICSPEHLCYKLYFVNVGMFALGGLAIVGLGFFNHKWMRWAGIFLGVSNLVMGERFFSRPVYDIFYQNSILWVFQIGAGSLCLSLALLQILRLRRR